MAAKVIWKASNVPGTLRWKGKEVRVRFSASCDQTGRLAITLEEIPFSTETLWLNAAFHSGGRYVDYLSLDGQTNDGRRIRTDYLYLTGISRSDSSIIPKGYTRWLDVTFPLRGTTPSGMTAVRYRIAGMEGYGRQDECCDLGRIYLAAQHRISNYDVLTGELVIQAHEHPNAMDEWITECDKKTDKILEILSLAQDRRLDWCVREVFCKGKRSSLLFVGPHSAAPPHHPIFSHLHLRPALTLAVHAYTDNLRDSFGMGFAIEYFLMRPLFVELKMLAAMTGLEHMLQRSSSRRRSGIVQSSLFKEYLLPAMQEGLATEIDRLNLGNDDRTLISAEAAELLLKKIKGINSLTLRDNLFSFLRRYRVPTEGISEDQIFSLVRTRNALAHARPHKETPHANRLEDDLIVLQELMRRIFLTLLGYRGKRDSFLNGQEWVDFPPPD